MKALIIIVFIVGCFLAIAWDRRKYPKCPKCGHNLNSKRLGNGMISCYKHGIQGGCQ